MKNQNEKIQQTYFRRAKIVAFILQFVPFVRAVFLTGSLARNEASRNSDIDFFVVTKKGRIWTCRILVTLLIEMMGMRRTSKKIAGQICLNRYQTEDYLKIEPHNAYHQKDYSQIWPLVGSDDLYLKYKKANRWIKNFKQQPKIAIKSWPKFPAQLLEKILAGQLGDFLEKKLKEYQKNRILADPRTSMSPREKIKATDQVLAFHPSKILKHLDK